MIVYKFISFTPHLPRTTLAAHRVLTPPPDQHLSLEKQKKYCVSGNCFVQKFEENKLVIHYFPT